MTIGRNNLSRADTVTITAIEMGVPSLVEARDAITEFQAMVRNKADVETRGLELRARQAVPSNQSQKSLARWIRTCRHMQQATQDRSAPLSLMSFAD